MSINNLLKGRQAEQKVIIKLMEHEFDILYPIYNHSPYDLAVGYKDKLYKIQVKSTRTIEKNNMVKCAPGRGKYKEGDFDYLVVYVFENDAFYVYPFSFVFGKTHFRLTEETKSFGRSRFDYIKKNIIFVNKE